MRLWNRCDPARSVRLTRLIANFVAASAILSVVTGCGPSRPDPLAVVKDGGDDDEDDKPKARNAQKPAAARPNAGVKPAGGAAAAATTVQPADVPSGTAPFDLSFLPVDTELLLVAQCADIVRSSLVQTVTAGELGALDPLVEASGQRFHDIETLLIGVRDLKDLPAPTRESLSAGLRGLSLRDVALNPDVSSTVVIRTRDRVDETPLRVNGELVRVGDKRYFRLKSITFHSVCACIQGFRTLIIADEPTILSIIGTQGPPPKPKATFSFVREADLVVAVAPGDPAEMPRWLPTLDLFGPEAESEPDAAAADPSDATQTQAESASDNPDSDAQQQLADDGAARAVSDHPAPTAEGHPPTVPGVELSADAGADAAIPAHVTGAALMLNLEQGVAISVSLNCDTPEAAQAAEIELQQLTSVLQETADVADGLSGGIRELVAALSTTRLQTIAALTTAIAPDRQTDVMTLPALVLGEEDAVDAANAMANAAAVGEPPGAFAERILVEGVPPLASDNPLPGMELRGLARWQPSPTGIEGPRQLELGVVAFGGPATTAVATGHFRLHEAEVNRLSPLKWLGTSPGYDVLGLSPIDGLVPVTHDRITSIHPRNGVLAVFTLVPPSEPATHLRRFRGQFVMRYFTISNEILVENLREAIRTKPVPPELEGAGVEFDLSRLAGHEMLELFYPESTSIGAVRLLTADGETIDEIESTRTSNQGKVLRTLTITGTLPEDVALSVTLNSELAEVEVPFEFANLPIPDVGTLSDVQRALLVWTGAEADSGLPEGLSVEAQARWDNPDAAAGQLVRAPELPIDDKRRPLDRGRIDRDDEPESRTRRLRPGQKSERPLRVLVDLTGPLVEEADAVGEAHVTSMETDFRTVLNLEGAWFRQQDVSVAPVPTSVSPRLFANGPPGGMRIAFHFTPPLEPIHELTRFNGSVRLRVSQNRSEFLFSDLQQRAGRRLTSRELTRLGVALVARVEQEQILVRLLDGRDEQISELIAVDTFGDPIPGVVATVDEAADRKEGRRVHTLRFVNGVPTGVGLRVVANSSVRIVDVPFRFTKLPVPPAPGLPGL